MSKPLTEATLTTPVKLVVFDFDGVFTDNTVWTDQHGNESVRCWRSDGLGLSKLARVGVKAYVLSTEQNAVVAARCKKLNIPCLSGLSDKAQALQQLVQEQAVSLEQTVYVGNDMNDIGCLQLAGCSIVVADAYPAAVAAAQYQTTKPGGFGAVREVCDWIESSYA